MVIKHASGPHLDTWEGPLSSLTWPQVAVTYCCSELLDENVCGMDPCQRMEQGGTFLSPESSCYLNVLSH